MEWGKKKGERVREGRKEVSAKSGARESERRAWQKRRRDGKDARFKKDGLTKEGFG